MKMDLNIEKFTQSYNQLNARQREAVDTIYGPVIVLAGPGTGKTQLLSMRVANILRQTDYTPNNILCLTFTDTGAQAMRARLSSIIGPAAYAVRIHTFHSFCNEVIASNPQQFGFFTEMRLVNDLERYEIMQEICTALPYGHALQNTNNPTLYLKSALGAISTLKREGFTQQMLSELLSELSVFLNANCDHFDNLKALKHTQLNDEIFTEIAALLQQDNQQSAAARMLLGAILTYQETGYADDGEQKKGRTKLRKSLCDTWDKLTKSLPKQQGLAEVYEQYQQKLVEKGLYDFEDMLQFVVQAFEKNADLLTDYQEQLQFILVDEYQDTNGVQNRLLELLIQDIDTPNLFVVGDDKQAIYRFQGASLDNILYFHARFKGQAKVISLTDNYRSHQVILDAADAMMQHSALSLNTIIPGLETKLVASRINTPKPIDVNMYNYGDEEASAVADEIKQLLTQGVAATEIAVIYRKHKHAANLIPALQAKGVNYRVDGSDNILQHSLVQNLIKLLEFLTDFENDIALWHVLNLDILDLPALSLMKVSRLAAREKIKLVDALIDEKFLARHEVNNADKLLATANDLAQLAKLTHNTDALTLLQQVIERLNINNVLYTKPNRLELLSVLRTFYEFVRDLLGGKTEVGIDGLVRQLKTMITNELPLLMTGRKFDDKAILLTTAHRAKGLEFEYVFIINALSNEWEKGREPNGLELPPGILKADELIGERDDDERRLFFVAMTRAKLHLSISYSQFNAKDKALSPTRFIYEVSDRYIRKLGDERETLADKTILGVSRQLFLADNEQGWLKSQLQDYKMSVTHLNSFLKSPVDFFFTSILQVPQPKSSSGAFGTAVHETLREVHTYFLQHGQMMQIDQVLEHFEKQLGRQHLDPQDYEFRLQQGKEKLPAYLEHKGNNWAKQATFEYDFRSHNVQVGKALITGKLDLIEVIDEENKLARIIDYKTGNPDNVTRNFDVTNSEKGHNYGRQLVFYYLLAKYSTRFPYKIVSCHLEFVEPSKRSGKFVTVDWTVNEEMVQQMEQFIQEKYAQILDLAFPDNPQAEMFANVEWDYTS